MTLARQVAFLALQDVHRGAYADVALNRRLPADLSDLDRRLVTELVYGAVRRLRTLDALMDQLAKKPALQQPPNLRTILHLGLYQLRYLDHIPAAAAIHTTVDLAKQNHLAGLSGLVNGVLRAYQRQTQQGDPLGLPSDPMARLGVLHSYPDWVIQVWHDQLGLAATEQLCCYGNQSPTLDLRINSLRADRDQVQACLAAVGVSGAPLPGLPQALRITEHSGAIQKLPGFEAGWWTVQEASAQLVGHVLNPQPGETVLDLCAAPGGKTTHLAELMQGQGTLWGCDRTPSRLRKLKQNLSRLQMPQVQLWTGDSRHLPEEIPLADAILLDAPCSGLGTLHRHADARWRQTPASVQTLAQLQQELLIAAAQHTRPTGRIVYATCTLHPQENEAVIQQFLATHPDWKLTPPSSGLVPTHWIAPAGWIKIWPQAHNMDGFFVAQLCRNC
ncbi:16S rRNA (cytosine(967)-C(5))-methyltransferase [Synechococcales cyanobacterium C]|uniref:16S rRNA (cytosine(967)-C(5))-methyltransferase n=1 Tax=Petrachloros mirabilis ULC683 TaxID=2781853 RepID=A0A8K2A8R5_9CYAN|nr:16S rRNA (cytosine(967)-C(5))-methyltransferase [Petrachloros mirabilis]NCJ07464.1 16S rRNA (cytosine(967)-C(5))-methyltransferase [Petrachloros mirabilis ULC683]